MNIDVEKLKARGTRVDEYLEDRLNADPAFQAYWERTAFARALAIEVIRARAALNLEQVGLAERLGVPLEVVESLEEGEDDPNLETLRLLAQRLNLQFAVTVTLVASDDASALPPALHTRLDQSAA